MLNLQKLSRVVDYIIMLLNHVLQYCW